MKIKLKLYAVFLLLICNACELDPDFDPNAIPEVPTISGLVLTSPTELNCTTSCMVTFSASSNLSSPSNTGDAVSYTWDFGDGSPEVEGNDIMHEYTDLGEYPITVVAKAPDAQDQMLSATFIVNPNTTFVVSSPEDNFAMDIYELSDGSYIVFGQNRVMKYSKVGEFIRSIEGQFLSYIDYHVLEQDLIRLFLFGGSYFDYDHNLNKIGEGTLSVTNAIGYVVNNEEIYLLGSGDVDPFGFIDVMAFPQVPFTDPGNDQYFLPLGPSTSTPGEPVIWFPKHKQIGDSYFIQLANVSGNPAALYGFNGDFNWFTPLDNYDISSYADGEDGNILTLGIEQTSGNMILREVDKVTGTFGRQINLCASNLPCGLLKVSDGYIVVSLANDNDNCLPDGLEVQGINDIHIQKLDLSYNVIWDRVINISSTEYIHEIRQANDGGFLLTGLNRQNSRTEMCIIRTNAQGIVE